MPAKPAKKEYQPTLDIKNAIAAFSEDQVERLTRLSKSRLRYWARTNFFQPSYAEADGRLPYHRFYSFKDVVALRTLEILRVQKKVPLQHLRKAAEKLSHLRDDLWTKTHLFVVNKEVVFDNPETGKREAVVSGQVILGIPLQHVIRETSAEIVSLRQRRLETIGKVTRSKGIAKNSWVVDGTRIPVAAIQRFADDGFSIEAIIKEYPDLSPTDVKAALAHGKQKAA